jgi:hypothetical protein
MIDVGELATPAFFDYNNDDLLDLVVGNGGYYEGGGNYIFSLTLYENIGTNEIPAYKLIDRNYLELNGLGLDDLRPFFGDLDDDGDEDLIAGEKSGKIFIMDNVNNTFQNPRFLSDATGTNIDIGQSSHPILFDFNKDDKLDLIIGTRDGNLVYYENTGTTSNFQFTFVTDQLGFVLSHPSVSSLKYSSPAMGDFDGDGKTDLILGGADSRLKFYSDIGTNPTANFEKTTDNFLEELFFNFEAIDIRPRIVPSAADISNDGLFELVVGISNGGLEMYSQELADTNILAVNDVFISHQLQLFPNPVHSEFTVEWGVLLNAIDPILIQITDLLGRRIFSTIQTNSPHFRWSALEVAPGLYQVTIRQGNLQGSVRFVKH